MDPTIATHAIYPLPPLRALREVIRIPGSRQHADRRRGYSVRMRVLVTVPRETWRGNDPRSRGGGP